MTKMKSNDTKKKKDFPRQVQIKLNNLWKSKII